MEKPNGAIAVSDDKGRGVLAGHFQLDTILPHTSIDYPVNVTKEALGAGAYTTNIAVSYRGVDGGRTVERATPGLEVTSVQVTQVFTSAAPPTPPPGSAAGPVSQKSGGVSPVLIVFVVGGGLALLAGGWFAATARARRRRA
jgi:hypothetical protein